jgi:hemerythrin-like domain-containing protein
MTSIANVLCGQIRTSNEDFESVRKALNENDWETARASVNRAVASAQRHMQAEEDVLFKGLEQMLDSEATTRPLREDHERIRELLTALQQAIRSSARSESLALWDALDEVRGQHNAKSENHLYPLADRVMGKLGPALAQEMAWD